MSCNRLVEICEYGDLTKEMLRDRLVVGICDTKLSAQLQMDSALNLETAMKKVRQSEAVQEQRQHLQGDTKTNPIVLDELRRATKGGTKGRELKSQKTQQKTGSFPRVCRFAQAYKPCTLLHTSWETLVHCLEMNPSFQTWKLFVHGQFTRKCTTWKPTMFLL